MVKNKPFFSRIATDAAARRGAAQICDVTSSAQSKSPAHMLLSKITNVHRYTNMLIIKYVRVNHGLFLVTFI